ncbi:MAG: hypothetical protein WCD00_00020 [Desulfuromonadaceae bacterium]
MMNCQEVVAAAVVAGVVFALLVVPAVMGLRMVAKKLVALWQAHVSKGRAATRRKPKARRAKAGKNIQQARQPRKKADAAEVTAVSLRKKRVKPGNSGKLEKAVSSASDTTRRKPGRPSNAELARRAAEAAKAAEAKADVVVPSVAHETVVTATTHIPVSLLELSPDESVVMPIPEVSLQTPAENGDHTHTE